VPVERSNGFCLQATCLYSSKGPWIPPRLFPSPSCSGSAAFPASASGDHVFTLARGMAVTHSPGIGIEAQRFFSSTI
jgi:hypothetical protein